MLAFLLLLPIGRLSAQTYGWDTALDRYESICNQCIELRQKSLAGEPVPAASVADLLAQLASLRNSLQEAAGRMTPSQRARFESIRLRYTEAFADTSSSASSVALQSLHPIASSSELPPLSLSRPAESESSFTLSAAVPQPSVHSNSKTDALHSAAFHFGMVAYTSMPVLRPGLMARLDIGRSGLYIKGSLLPFSDHSYVCKSDGTTATGFIWTTGNERTGAISLSAGSSFAILSYSNTSNMLSRNSRSLPDLSVRLFAGAGYGSRSVLWEDVSGHWAQVSDLSFKGVYVDAGFLFDIGRLTLMTGVSTVSFRSSSFDLGLGFLF